MKSRGTLSSDMSLTAFDHGYWYAADLKRFAASIGIQTPGKLRKDELEQAIRRFLGTGATGPLPNRRPSASGVKDVDRGLRLDLPVRHYTSNKTTKTFIEREAQKIAPDLKRRSGARYRLNRWREAQLAAGTGITYGDLVHEYVRLNQSTAPFKRIPSTRYIHFLSDFLAARPGAAREEAIAAWREVKTLDAPKTYEAWAKHRKAKRPKRRDR